MPTGPWTWRQSWCDLLFAHWPLPADVIRPLVPAPLRVQECDGTAWIGVVPFRMEGVMRRPLPDLPWFSEFPELNVRTYVEFDGKPGVWFLSLDATSRLAVWAARRFFNLPYHGADISIDALGDGRFDYRLERRRSHGSEQSASRVAFQATYGPVGDVHEAKAGTLEHFLTERYCLYAQRTDDSIVRLDVHHAPWPLQRAEASVGTNTMTAPWGIALNGAPLVHFARRVEVVLWPPGAPGP